MIKFFRRIRMKAIDQANIKDYFIYALGEILLVMIGILLALQVNNWNQKRVEQAKEDKALTDLLEEFKINKQRIEEKQNLRFAVVPKLSRYIELISKGQADYQAFEAFHLSNYAVGITNPSNGVIDVLISSGELNLISNDSLKYLLADWKDQAGNLHENEQILWAATVEYTNYFREFLMDPSQKWKDWDVVKAQRSFDLLQATVPYRNRLVSLDACNKIVIEECKIVLASIDRMINLIKKEMNP